MGEVDPKTFLEELHKEKKTIEKYIKQLEESITENETKYLQSTVNGGNILRGWEHIFTSKSNKIHPNPKKGNNNISNNERLFSQTFEFDKNSEEIINTNDKIITQNNTINSNNNIKNESPKNANNSNLNNNTHKHKKAIRQSLGLKRKRNNNVELNQVDKPEQKNS